jgi:hypothetical protein
MRFSVNGVELGQDGRLSPFAPSSVVQIYGNSIAHYVSAVWVLSGCDFKLSGSLHSSVFL